jgi:thiol:disulfide interchange protein
MDVNKPLHIVLGLTAIVSIGLGALLTRGWDESASDASLHFSDTDASLGENQAKESINPSAEAISRARPIFLSETKGTLAQGDQAFFEPITILPVDEAFPFDFWWQEGRLGLRWQVKDGYYLYRDRFLLTASDGESISLPLPEGRLERDPYFGDVYVLEAPIDLELALGKPIEQSYLQAQERLGPSGGFEVTYQGCAKQGYCYPPQKRLISVADRSR